MLDSAPEVITRQPYTPSVDNWTLGVLMYILLSGYHPFDVYGELSEPELLQKIIDVKYDYDDPVWSNVSTEAKSLITRLLIYDPVKRLSLHEYLQSPWVKHSEGTNTHPVNNVVVRLQSLATGKTGLKAIVLAKLASQKFKASVNNKHNTDGNMFHGINSITKKHNNSDVLTVDPLLVHSINNKIVG